MTDAGHKATLRVVLEAGAPDRVAIRVPEDGVGITAETLAEDVERLSGQLHRVGVRRGDRVAIVVPNGPEFIELLLATAVLGAAAAPLNPAYTESEHAFFLGDLEPRVLLVPAGGAAAARAACPPGVAVVEFRSHRGQSVQLSLGGSTLTPREPHDSPSPDDIALLLHTSGTTSRPKLVPLLHRNLTASAMAIADHYSLGPNDVSFCVMPLFHVHGLVASVLATFVSGGSVVVPRRLGGTTFWRSLAGDRVTWLSGSPTLLTMLADQRPRELLTPELRFVRSCSSALSENQFERFEREFGVPLLQAYGMTEASHQITSNPLPPLLRSARTVGMAAGASVAILDPDGLELGDGCLGEVAIMGPGVIEGYVNNFAADADAFIGSWFRTGDRGVLEDGYLTLEGRIKELIIRGGENISPSEIEAVLLRHEAVMDVVCFGVPDAKYGEVVAAAVISDQPVDSRALADHCRDHLAAFKVPKFFHRVESFPRTPTGKVQRRLVAARVAESG